MQPFWHISAPFWNGADGMFISQDERAGLFREARVEALWLREMHGDAAEHFCDAQVKRARIFTRRRRFWKIVRDTLVRTNNGRGSAEQAFD